MAGGNGRWGMGDFFGGLGDEFRAVAVTEKRDDGDEADGDGDEDGVPAGSRGVEAIGNAQARGRGEEETRQEMEGQGAERGTNTREDGSPEEFGEEPLAFPKIGGIAGSDGANFG